MMVMDCDRDGLLVKERRDVAVIYEASNCSGVLDSAC